MGAYFEDRLRRSRCRKAPLVVSHTHHGSEAAGSTCHVLAGEIGNSRLAVVVAVVAVVGSDYPISRSTLFSSELVPAQ